MAKGKTPEEVKKIIRELYPKGELKMSEIADHLNGLGHTTKTGLPWKAANVSFTALNELKLPAHRVAKNKRSRQTKRTQKLNGFSSQTKAAQHKAELWSAITLIADSNLSDQCKKKAISAMCEVGQ